MFFLVAQKYCSIHQIRWFTIFSYFFMRISIEIIISYPYLYSYSCTNSNIFFALESGLPYENPQWWLLSYCSTNWIWDNSRKIDADNIIFYRKGNIFCTLFRFVGFTIFLHSCFFFTCMLYLIPNSTCFVGYR